MNANSSWQRGDQLFAPNGVVGGPIRAIENMQDIGPEYGIKDQVQFVIFERLMADPIGEMNKIFRWLGLPQYNIDINSLVVKPHETDSYYRFKYRHNTFGSIIPPKTHTVSIRIAREIYLKFKWLFTTFYPEAYHEFRELSGESKLTGAPTPPTVMPPKEV